MGVNEIPKRRWERRQGFLFWLTLPWWAMRGVFDWIKDTDGDRGPNSGGLSAALNLAWTPVRRTAEMFAMIVMLSFLGIFVAIAFVGIGLFDLVAGYREPDSLAGYGALLAFLSLLAVLIFSGGGHFGYH